MDRNNNVYLLVGPRAAGKTEYAEKLIARDPSLNLISRDKILIKTTGSEHNDPYSENILFVVELINRLLRFKLSRYKNQNILLEYFLETSSERKNMTEELREYGASKVVALYFTTPVELVNKWFWQKPGIAKISEMKSTQGRDLVYYSEDSPERDYCLFHNHAQGIDSDGFDQVIRINPLEPLIHLD